MSTSSSDDLADIAGKVAKIVRDMQAEREQNRRDFPLMASYLKLLERFNPRAIWAEENGKRIGRIA
jgi:hypothetical protein